MSIEFWKKISRLELDMRVKLPNGVKIISQKEAAEKIFRSISSYGGESRVELPDGSILITTAAIEDKLPGGRRRRNSLKTVRERVERDGKIVEDTTRSVRSGRRLRRP